MIQQLARHLRSRFHPLYFARRNRLLAPLLKRLRIRAWARHPQVAFPYSIDLLRDASHLAAEDSEDLSLALLVEAIRGTKTPCLYDIGANLGIWSWMAKTAAPDCQVHLFEPFDGVLPHLEETIRLNRLAGVQLHPLALSDHTGVDTFRSNALDSTTGTLVEGIKTAGEKLYREKDRTVKIQTATLDSLDIVPGPTVIKIDVEGAEHLVIKGAIGTIEKHKPILFVETREQTLPPILSLLAHLYSHRRIESISGGAVENYLFTPR